MYDNKNIIDKIINLFTIEHKKLTDPVHKEIILNKNNKKKKYKYIHD